VYNFFYLLTYLRCTIFPAPAMTFAATIHFSDRLDVFKMLRLEDNYKM